MVTSHHTIVETLLIQTEFKGVHGNESWQPKVTRLRFIHFKLRLSQAELDAHEASLFSSLTGLGKRSGGVTKTKFMNLWTGWHRSLSTKNKMKSVHLLKMSLSSLSSLCRIMLRWLWPNLFQEICYAVVTLPTCLLLLFGNTSFRMVFGFVEVSWGIFR